MLRAIAVEVSKLRRATLPLWTVVTVLIAPALSNVFGSAGGGWTERTSWADFVGLGPMTMGTWYGILLFGLIAAFIFGREYTEGVAASLLSAPVRREVVVLAKLVVLVVWVFVLALLAVAAQAAWATVLGLRGFAWAHLWSLLGDTLVVALLIFLTLPVVTLVAVVSRGVFAPMIVSAFGFTAGMLGGIAGWSDWFPWAMPAAIGGTFLDTTFESIASPLDAASWAIALAVFIGGVVATTLWVDRADSTR